MVQFVGLLNQAELPRFFTTLDVYVSTSLSDAGISASTAEAMASGQAVVVSDSGENNLWIDDGSSGFVVPVKSPDVLAAKLVELLLGPSLRVSFGERARRTITERNDYYREMSKMGALYEELAASR